MFGLFSRKKEAPQVDYNYNSIAVDLHSHVLPAIDDGSQSPEDSIELISRMMELGIRKIIATPHIMADYYKNNATTINAALTLLKQHLAAANMDITIEAAAEHYFDEHFLHLIDSGELMLIKDKYVLFELPFTSKPFNVIGTVQKLTDKGFIPILAHPERYPYLTLNEATDLKSWGCMLQLNTISLTGYYGKDVKKSAENLVNNNLISFISSDMHHVRHAQAFKNVLQQPMLQTLLDSGLLKNTELL